MALATQTAAQPVRYWGELSTQHSRDEVLEAMRGLSKAGKLAGFAESKQTQSELFRVAAFAMPFDHELVAHARDDAGKTLLAFAPKLLLKMPIAMIIVSVLSVWPGVWLTDSMIRTYFPSYDYNTNLWYIPLTVLSLVWYGIGSWRRSAREARESAHEAMLKIEAVLPGAKLTSAVGITTSAGSPEPSPT